MFCSQSVISLVAFSGLLCSFGQIVPTDTENKTDSWPVQTSCAAVKYNTECVGHAFVEAKTPHHEQCCDMCASNRDCGGMTFDGSTCYLKKRCESFRKRVKWSAGTMPSRVCPGCTAVFYPIPGSKCFRIPSIIRTHKGTLVAFSENRPTGCGDDATHHHLLVARRSTDGVHWSDLIIVKVGDPPCHDCPPAISNPNPVEVRKPDGTYAIILHYDTMNNPKGSRHGLDMQQISYDDGITWSAPTVLSYPPQANVGTMIGPSIGIQSATGEIYFCGQHFLYKSTNYGASWSALHDNPVHSECSIAFAHGPENAGSIVQIIKSGNTRTVVNWENDKPVATRKPSNLYGAACQGSLLYNRGSNALYLSQPSGSTDRKNMVVRRSDDGGVSWSKGVTVWTGPSAYSQLVDIGSSDHVGLLFECGTHSDYETISFVRVPATAEAHDMVPRPEGNFTVVV